MNPVILFVSLVTVLTSPAAFAAPKDIDCRVESVHLGIYEEGLGEYGGADVDGDSQEVSVSFKGADVERVRVGQMSWDQEDGDELTLTQKGAARVITIVSNDSTESLKVQIYESERGMVLYREGRDPWQTLVSIDCSSVRDVMDAYETSKNVRELKPSDTKKLSKKIRDRINAVDIAFEMGDGYYDIKEEKLFEVLSQCSQPEVLGYLVWAALSYSEGDDTEAYVRFDRNGLRLNDEEFK